MGQNLPTIEMCPGSPKAAAPARAATGSEARGAGAALTDRATGNGASQFTASESRVVGGATSGITALSAATACKCVRASGRILVVRLRCFAEHLEQSFAWAAQAVEHLLAGAVGTDQPGRLEPREVGGDRGGTEAQLLGEIRGGTRRQRSLEDGGPGRAQCSFECRSKMGGKSRVSRYAGAYASVGR